MWIENEAGRKEERKRAGAMGADEYGPAAANRSIPLIAQLARANDRNAI